MVAEALDEQKGKILGALLTAGEKVREEFLATGAEIEKYAHAKNHDFEYQATDSGLFFKATVKKTAQAIDIFVPMLCPAYPQRQVTARPWADDMKKARAQLMSEYLNYTPGECDAELHARRAVTQGITHGRGVLWTGYNQRKKLVQSVFDTVDNLVVDPDARVWEEVNWVARRRVKPRWWLLKNYPDAKAMISDMKANAERPSESGARTADFTADMICFYEVYARIGLHNYRDGRNLLAAANGDMANANPDEQMVGDDAPKKFVVTKDGKLIAEMEWEIPFHMDDEWPCTVLDFIEKPGSIWSISPLEPGLGHQRALNWIYTLYLSKMRFATRTCLATAKYNGEGLDQENLKKALYGDGLIEVIEIEINGEMLKLPDLLQQMNFTTGVDELERLVALVNTEYEKSTGLYEILYTGATETQARSAAEIQMKERNSHQRTDDRKDRVAKFLTKVARKEALAARFLHSPEDIGLIFGPQAAQVWGQLMPPLHLQLEQLQAQAQQRGYGQYSDMFVQANLNTDGVVFEDWVHETDYSIEAGSMRRQDIDQAIDASDRFMNQGFSALMTAGQVVPALAGLRAWAVVNMMPQPFIDAIDLGVQMASMPQPMPVAAPPKGQAPARKPAPAGAN